MALDGDHSGSVARCARQLPVDEIALSREPGLGTADGPPPSLAFGRDEVGALPAVEDTAAGEEVEDAVSVAPFAVVREVAKEVREPERGLLRRLQVVAMVAIRPDFPATPQHHVEAAGERDLQPADPRAKRIAPFGVLGISLDDEVEVIGLERVVNDAKVVLVPSAPLVAQHLG